EPSTLRDVVDEDQAAWRPLVFDRADPQHADAVDELLARGRVWQTYDLLREQLVDLIRTRSPHQPLDDRELGVRLEVLLGETRLDSSNMNRIRAGVHEVGLNKAVLAARQIYEMNPYARICICPDGVLPENLDNFLSGEQPVDVLVDECDSLAMKFQLREAARAR